MSRLSGALTIITGLVLLVFPWFGLWTLSAILGLILIVAGVGLLILGAFTYGSSKGAAVGFLILGLLGLIAGVGIFGDVGAFAAVAGLALYISGAILIVAGLVHFFKPRTRFSRAVGAVGILLGVIYIILGSYATDPRDLSILMGIWLIIVGITGSLR
jgi:uncharacterized membrane protein HdeD (DUF308 family)